MKIFKISSKDLRKTGHWSPNKLIFDAQRKNIEKVFSYFNEENRIDHLTCIPRYSLYRSVYLRKIKFLFVIDIDKYDQFNFRYRINNGPFYVLKTLTLDGISNINSILKIMNDIMREFE